MKAALVIVFACLLTSARAANYYFSSVSGNDSVTSSEAGNPVTPWKTLNKLNSIFSNLKPGDSVFLKRNETFYGSILLRQSGSTVSPIVISAYGSGKKPVITSLITLADWVPAGNGIWETSDSLLGSTANMVLLNGVEYGMGRYPNRDAPNNGYLNFESHDSTTSITDNELTTSIDWTGAELVLRPRHWILDRDPITFQSGSTIYYSASSPYEPFENYGYFIQNSINTLDEFGEWYYDPSTKKFSAYFGLNNPSSYVLQVATMGDLVFCANCKNIEFNNLTIKGANGAGFRIIGGSNINIRNCDILFSGEDGVKVMSNSGFEIQNCTILNQNNNGIDLELGDSAVIRYNKIINTYLVAGMGESGDGKGLGISLNSSNSIVEHNEIRNTGYQGIYFNGSDVTIKNNLIDSFCITKDDGAGIYSTMGPVVYKGRKIIGNIIVNGIGTGKGTNDSNKVAAHGIYMDNNASEVDIRNNTIANCVSNGINIHNSFGMTMENNTAFNNAIQLNMVQDADNVPIRDCILTGNILFSKYTDQWVSSLKSSADDIKLFGYFDSNYYARPLDDGITIYNNYVASNGGLVIQNFDLAGWQQASGQDEHSKKTAKQISLFTIDSLAGNNKFVNGGDFTNDIKGVSGSLCILSRGSSGLLDSGYLQVTPFSRGASFFLKIGSVTAGKNYILSYSLAGSVDSNMSIGASVRQSAPPFAYLTPIQSRPIGITRTENEILFSPVETQSSASVVFKVDNQNQFYIDNIKFYEAATKVTNPDDSIRFEYNATGVNNTVPLNGNYIDATGKLYINRIILQPYLSAVLIKTSDSVKNIAPTVSITTPQNNDVFAAFSSVTISAVAADVDGSITKVEFYNDSILLKTEYKPGYDCTLDSVAPGSYSITAKATDNNGISTSSSPVAFSVSALKIAPAVTITTPANNAVFSPFSSVHINAAASDIYGSIAKVEFYNGSTLLKTERKSPYDCTLDSIAPGNYTITAKATNSVGMVTTSSPIFFSVDFLNHTPFTGVIATPEAFPVSVMAQQALKRPESGLPGISKNSRIETDMLLSRPDFRLSPNPGINILQLYFDGFQIYQKVSLIIQNVSGATVKKCPIIISGKKTAVDISSLSPGIYIIGISNDSFTINKKFFKVSR